MLVKRRKMMRKQRLTPKLKKKRMPINGKHDSKWTKVTTRRKSHETESMDVEEGEASEDPDDDASSVAESVDVTEATHDPSDEDVPTSVSDKSVWDNARNHFQDRKPMCFSDCRKGHSTYALPDPIDRDGHSDDEEWLREERTDESPNKFYAVWIHKLKSFLTEVLRPQPEVEVTVGGGQLQCR